MMIEEVLNFWFGTNADDAVVAAEQAALWWSKNQETDDDIRSRFEHHIRAAARRELDPWASTAHGRLALIILLDQFPRNVYRETAQAFSYDQKALALSLEGIARGTDWELRAIERVFIYLPLEHSESLAHQERSVRYFSDLVACVPAEQKSFFDEYLNYAIRHRDIIARFGRFPHRNKILGRESTTEELAFLAKPGSSF
ncbi:MAG TPA: DUF924 family protein [Candidatus Binatia bacterium]